MRHPDIRTCRDVKKLCFRTISIPEVCLIRKTTTSCQCHVHLQSHEVNCGPWCDPQAFELAVTWKNLCLWTILYLGCVWFARLRQAVTALCILCQIWHILRLDATPRHLNLLWWKKFLFRFWLEVQQRIKFARLRLPVHAKYTCCQIWCILRLDATPRHSNMLSCKNLSLWTILYLGCVWFARLRHPVVATCTCNPTKEIEGLDATQTFEHAVMQKFILVNNFVFGVCLIRKSTTSCSCHVHLW